MVLSLYLRSTLGIIFFPSLNKFGGAFEEPFLRQSRSPIYGRCAPVADIAAAARRQETSGQETRNRDKFHCPLQIGVGRGGGAG
jgi:hypothetical protein